MKSKHTQGEWRVGDNYREVTTSRPGILEGSKTVAKISQFSKSEDTIIANAKLIAAAPELLEACQEAMRIVDLWSPSYSKENIKESDISELAALSLMRRSIEQSLKKATK